MRRHTSMLDALVRHLGPDVSTAEADHPPVPERNAQALANTAAATQSGAPLRRVQQLCGPLNHNGHIVADIHASMTEWISMGVGPWFYQSDREERWAKQEADGGGRVGKLRCVAALELFHRPLDLTLLCSQAHAAVLRRAHRVPRLGRDRVHRRYDDRAGAAV